VAVQLLETETRCLRLIAPCVPVRVPEPKYVGAPSGDCPYPFMGYPLIAGTTACRVTWSDESRSALAAPLGRFLAALHTIPIDAEVRQAAPLDEIRRADRVTRRAKVIENLRRVAPLVPDVNIEAHIAAIERLASAPPAESDGIRLVHGDFYARHLIVDESLALSGVIDWGDVHLGDPALDLSIAFTFLPASAYDVFRTAYGIIIDDAAWDRARFRGIHYGAILTLYGADIADNAIREAGEYALRTIA
jgi:aminoglycoside phosphotransferase (APT) family kinase protein